MRTRSRWGGGEVEKCPERETRIYTPSLSLGHATIVYSQQVLVNRTFIKTDLCVRGGRGDKGLGCSGNLYERCGLMGTEIGRIVPKKTWDQNVVL
jgi:hypothetical protein